MSRAQDTGDDGEHRTTRLTGEDEAGPAGSRQASPEGSHPEQVGRYRITGIIGSGGMGIVLRGHDEDLARDVAIKLLDTSKRHKERAHARMQREARAMARLAHPNVVMVHEVGMHEGQVFIAMEYVVGTTLREWMKGQHSQAEILAMFIAAGRGLAAAHHADIIHRDFKPDNVLVGDDGRARVVDFGLAATLAEGDTGDADDPPGAPEEGKDPCKLTHTGAIMGTPAYMAPEQFDAAATDARTDQFAFCVALYEALYRRRPFHGTTMVDLARAVKSGSIAEAPGTRRQDARVSRRLRRAVVKGLARDPADRFASMEALLDELEAAGARQRASKRRGLPIAAGIGVGMLAVVAVGVGVGIDRRGQKNHAIPTRQESPPATPELHARQLTRAKGYGIQDVTADPAGRRLLYRDDETYHIRDLAGGVPVPVSVAGASPVLAVFDKSGEGVIALADNVLYRVDAAGNASAITTLETTPIGFVLSPDGRSLAIGERDALLIWDLEASPARRTAFKLPGFPVGLDWSPDSRRLAINMQGASETGGLVHLVEIIDPQRGAIASLALESMHVGLAWVAPGAAIITRRADAEVQLRCVHITDESIVLGEAATVVDVPAGTGFVTGRAGKSAVLLQMSVQHRIAGVLEHGAPRRLSLTSPDFSADEDSPVWLSSDVIAFLSDRYLTRFSVLRAERRDLSRIEVLVDKDARSLESDGHGGIVVDRRGPEGSSLDHAASVKEPLRPVFSPPRGLEHDQELRCVSPRQCVLGSESTIAAFDLATGASHERMKCPSGYLCGGVDRWQLSPDGQKILLPRADQQGLSVFELASGEKRWSTPTITETDIVQSGAWLGDSGSFIVTGIRQGGHDEPYTVWRVDPEGRYEVLWSSSSVWVISPRVAPDGTAVALSGRSFQVQTWQVELDGFCQGK